jgi:hypothetical protein
MVATTSNTVNCLLWTKFHPGRKNDENSSRDFSPEQAASRDFARFALRRVLV